MGLNNGPGWLTKWQTSASLLNTWRLVACIALWRWPLPPHSPRTHPPNPSRVYRSPAADIFHFYRVICSTLHTMNSLRRFNPNRPVMLNMKTTKTGVWWANDISQNPLKCIQLHMCGWGGSNVWKIFSNYTLNPLLGIQMRGLRILMRTTAGGTAASAWAA